MSNHLSPTSVPSHPRVIEEGTSQSQAVQGRAFRHPKILIDLYAALFELIGTVESSPACFPLSLALTSRRIPGGFRYVRLGRHSEHGFQSGAHWCDLCRPASIHFGVDGVLPVVYGLALREVRDSGFGGEPT